MEINSDLKNTLVVIPARGGSKRIPKKNIALISDKPMIHWPITELSKLFTPEQVLVSTDDEEIRQCLNYLGLDFTYKRPDYLADDQTITIDVVRHATEWFMNNHRKIEHVLIVYPTAVFFEAEDILEAYVLNQASYDGVYSIAKFFSPIERALYITEENKLKMNDESKVFSRTQDLHTFYFDAAQFYLYKVNSVLKRVGLTTGRFQGKELKNRFLTDIDNPEDLNYVRKISPILNFSSKKNNWLS